MEAEKEKPGIDVVYPLKEFGSRWKDNEIRYSLRSVEKHLHGVRNVYIIGHKPEFLQNVIHIPAKDADEIPDNNILQKVLVACKTPEISSPFLFMNDDHYLLADFDAETFPSYKFHTLSAYVERRGNDGYGRRARNTLKYLKDNGLPDNFFDIHFPILYDKKKAKEIFSKLPKIPDGYILKSIYANALRLPGEEIRDCKF